MLPADGCALPVELRSRLRHFARIREANGSPRLANVPPDQDAQEFELHFAPAHRETGELRSGPIQLDVLTSKEPGGQGAIANFLRKFGEGIQQVEFEVEDVDRGDANTSERFGQKAIYPQTRAGADGTRVNFFLASLCRWEKAADRTGRAEEKRVYSQHAPFER